MPTRWCGKPLEADALSIRGQPAERTRETGHVQQDVVLGEWRADLKPKRLDRRDADQQLHRDLQRAPAAGSAHRLQIAQGDPLIPMGRTSCP